MTLGRRKLIIDTNLLLLLIIGSVEGGKHIGTSKRLNKFSSIDYDLILKVMGDYSVVAITPYIAAEVSNLIDLDGWVGALTYEIARGFFSEFYQITPDLISDVSHHAFTRFGITDCSLVKLAESYVIFTDDSRLLPSLYEANPDNVLPFEAAKTMYRG